MYTKACLLVVLVWSMGLSACAEPPTSPLVEPDPPDTVWVRDHYFDTQTAIFFSADGSRIFCSSAFRKQVNVLQTSTGDLLHKIEMGTEVNSCALSPDGNTLAVAGADEKVYLVDAHTYAVKQPLVGHEVDVFDRLVNSVAFSPDGRFLVSSGYDQVIVWEMPTGKQLFSFGKGEYPARSVFLGSSGEFMYTSRDSLVVVRLPEGSIVRKMPEINEFGLRQSKYVAAVGLVAGHTRTKDGSIDRVVLVDPTTGQVVRTLYEQKEALRSFAVSPGGRYIVTTSEDGYVQIWETSTGTLVRSMAIKNEWGNYIPFTCVAVSPDSTHIVTAVDAVYLWRALWNPATGIAGGGTAATNAVLSAPYPVPGSDEITFRYTVPTASDVVVEVYTAHGERVAVVVSQRAEAGEHTAVFHPSQYNLSSGTYYCRLVVNNTAIATHSFPLAK